MKPDPVFALILAHRQSVAAFSAIVSENDALDQRGVDTSRGTKDPIGREFWARYEAVHSVMDKAEMRLCKTRPTTLAGITALTLYLCEAWNMNAPGQDRWDVEAPEGKSLERLLRTIAAAAEAIQRRNAAVRRAKVLPFRKAA